MLEYLGVLSGLALLIGLAYRGWSVLGLAPVAAMVAAAAAGEPLLAHYTQTFMQAAAKFVADFFPLFLLGALFGKLMDDSGAVRTIAEFMIDRFGSRRAVLAVVVAGALVTYGGVSLFVAMFVIVPMGQALFRTAKIPKRLLPAAVALGTSTFTMSALPGTPAIQNTIPIPFFGTTAFAAPGLGVIAAVITSAFGLWWLSRAVRRARASAEGFGEAADVAPTPRVDLLVRERATTSGSFDPAEIHQGRASGQAPGIVIAIAPLAVVVAVNVTLSLVVLPRLDLGYLNQEHWGGVSDDGVRGIWSVIVISTNLLAALTGSASGGLTIALDALAGTYTRIAAASDIDPSLLHRVAVLGAGTLDNLPHNGAVVTLFALCGTSHRESYGDLAMVGIVGAMLGLAAVVALGSMLGSF